MRILNSSSFEDAFRTFSDDFFKLEIFVSSICFYTEEPKATELLNLQKFPSKMIKDIIKKISSDSQFDLSSTLLRFPITLIEYNDESIACKTKDFYPFGDSYLIGFIPFSFIKKLVIGFKWNPNKKFSNEDQRDIEILLTALLNKAETGEFTEGYLKPWKTALLSKPIENYVTALKVEALNRQIMALLKIPIKSIVITDCDGKILIANEKTGINTSIETSNFIGKNIFDFLSEEVAEALKFKIEMNDFADPIQYQNFCFDTWLENFVFATYNEKNEVELLSFFELDITNLKRQEEEFERTIEEVQYNKELVEENAYEIIELNNKLYFSELRLKELNANKDKFFSIISHDLKSPLTALLGFSELIVSEYENLTPAELKEFTENLYSASKGLYNLLENLLQWARIQTGSISFVQDDFNLAHLITEILSIYHITSRNKEIYLISEIDLAIYLYADQNMINTVLRNLLSNAIKFTPRGGKINILAENNGDICEITVKDNGLGMKRETIDKLFRIDVHHTTPGTEQEKGTGLGLILCKDFVEKNEGKIRVDSNFGAGSSFIFTVPLAKKP